MPAVIKVLISAFVLLVVIGNGCSSQHLGYLEGKVDMMSLYPYEQKVDFFDDVQIINKEQDSQGVWNYQFAASVVDADVEDREIDVELDVVDQEGQRVCPRTFVSVNRTNNHIQVQSCRSDRDLKFITVHVRVGRAGESLTLLRSHPFDIQDL